MKARRLTLAIATRYVRILGGRLKPNDFDEFVVTVAGGEYFASDLEDAVATARAMAWTAPARSDADSYLLAQVPDIPK